LGRSKIKSVEREEPDAVKKNSGTKGP